MAQPDSLSRAWASSVDVLILLDSLAQNASQAIGETAGKITIEFQEDDSFVDMIVADTGGGMSADQVAEIGPAMGKIDKSKLGLGLIAVAETMYSLRGKVQVSSTAGQGTAFTLRFAKES